MNFFTFHNPGFFLTKRKRLVKHFLQGGFLSQGPNHQFPSRSDKLFNSEKTDRLFLLPEQAHRCPQSGFGEDRLFFAQLFWRLFGSFGFQPFGFVSNFGISTFEFGCGYARRDLCCSLNKDSGRAIFRVLHRVSYNTARCV
jgi:hypothetical protein